MDDVQCTDASPALAAQRGEERTLLKRELMAMPLEHREVVLLRDFHNLSYSEIAKVLGVPQGTIMSRLHRARTELRRRMQQYWE